MTTDPSPEISDEIRRIAHDTVDAIYGDQEGWPPLFDIVDVAIAAVAPRLRAEGMREACEMTFWSCANGIKAGDYGLRDAIAARAAELEKDQ